MKTKDLILIAMYTALFVVMEVISKSLGILQMPQGGSLSLSSIVLLLASYQLGFKKSLVVCVLSVLFKVSRSAVVLSPLQFFLDYFVAYGVYATAVLFKDWGRFPVGTLVANFLRYMAANAAGWIFFASYYPGNVLFGVMQYNAIYMLPNLIFSIVMVSILKPAMKRIQG